MERCYLISSLRNDDPPHISAMKRKEVLNWKTLWVMPNLLLIRRTLEHTQNREQNLQGAEEWFVNEGWGAAEFC